MLSAAYIRWKESLPTWTGRLEEEGDEGGMSRLENDLLFINEHIQVDFAIFSVTLTLMHS